MSLSHDVCALFYARRSKAVDPVGRRQQVGRDYTRWLADGEEEGALKLADEAEGIEEGRARNVRGQSLYRTLRHAVALALASPEFFRDRLTECGETATPKPADLARASECMARFREAFAASFEDKAIRCAEVAEMRRSRGEMSEDNERFAAEYVARAHEVRTSR